MTMRMPAATGAAPAFDWAAILSPSGRWGRQVRAGSSPDLIRREMPGGAVAFLATPYAAEVHLKKVFRPQRSALMSTLAAREMVRLYLAGVTAICPVLQLAEMCHAAGLVDGALVDPLDSAAWAQWSRPMLESSTVLVVPDLQGWARCPLIALQAGMALSLGRPVHVYARGMSA